MLEMWTNEMDFIIAESEEDAKQILREIYGNDALVIQECVDEVTWCTMDPNSKFDFGNDDGTITTRTVEEFIQINGRGYFACADY